MAHRSKQTESENRRMIKAKKKLWENGREFGRKGGARARGGRGRGRRRSAAPPSFQGEKTHSPIGREMLAMNLIPSARSFLASSASGRGRGASRLQLFAMTCRACLVVFHAAIGASLSLAKRRTDQGALKACRAKRGEVAGPSGRATPSNHGQPGHHHPGHSHQTFLLFSFV